MTKHDLLYEAIFDGIADGCDFSFDTVGTIATRAAKAAHEYLTALHPAKTVSGANGQSVEIVNGIEVDAEIADLVRALNAADIETVASCSGHSHRPGNIALRDGRELIIARDFDEARRIEGLFPLDINGDAAGESL